MSFLGMSAEEVGEEEDLEDGKHDEEFDEDDGPERAAERHVAEAVVVEVPDTIEKAVLVHTCC